MDRITIALEGDLAEKLGRLAERMHIQPDALAAALLSAALDDADPDARKVVELLDGIRDAHQRAELGLRHASARETVALDELAIRGAQAERDTCERQRHTVDYLLSVARGATDYDFDRARQSHDRREAEPD
jgi:hypothetical protein